MTITPSDRELMERVVAGDEAALATLFDRHSRSVLGLLTRLVGTNEAEELLQEVFLQVWRDSDRYRPGRAAPKTWFLILARSRAIDRLRSREARRARERSATMDSLLDGQPIAPPAALEQLERSERRHRVRQALETLPSEQSSAIEMAFFGGLTYREVSEHQDVPLGTIKSRISLGMQKLRQHLVAAS